MTWGARRQLIYASIVIGFFVAVAIAVVLYFLLSKTPTCFDGIQNQDERGIDCGGVCELVCAADAFSVLPLWSQAAPVTDTIYHAVAYVENQNVGSGTESFDYRFSLYDSENILIAERTGSTFLGPNERTAIFESGIDVGNRVPSLVFFETTKAISWQKAPLQFSKQLLTVEETEGFNIEREPKITAKVRNESIYRLDDIDVIVLVYDPADNLIATSMTFVDRFEPGSSKEVFFTWPQPFKGTPARVEIVPRLNPFIQ